MPDPRLAALDAIVHSKQVIPATVEFVDIAGLVRGASQGEGLGNQFLGHIRETDAIVHVVRCFEDSNVVHVDGAPDPVRDVETIETELGLADIATVEKRLDRVARQAKSGDKDAKAQSDLFTALLTHLSNGAPARSFAVPEALAGVFRDCHLLTAKPVLYVANVDDASLAAGNAYSATLEEYAEKSGAGSVRICGQAEAELSELADDEKIEFLHELGMDEPGLHRLVHAAYALLDLITFFTAGEKEVKAWTIRRGTSAPKAAGTIHTDFERGFIRAEVIGYDAYVAAGSETAAKAKGAMRVEGKEYVMQDGDVVHFRVGV